jgi:hypothetical protein
LPGRAEGGRGAAQGGENAEGAFRNDGAYKTRSYRQTSLVVEPEDGRTPAFTAEALKRPRRATAAASARGRSTRRWTSRSTTAA